MTLYNPASHPLPDLAAGELIAQMPIAEAIDGPLFDRQEACDHNDRVFAAWDAPLVWAHQKSQVKVSGKFRGQRAVHFAFEDRIPEDVWQKNWTLWYDHALLTRRHVPGDLLLTGTFALEEVATGMGSDNVEHIAPWAGIVARMQDLRRYYFLTLEYPNRVVLYRREDHQWVEVAWAQVYLDVFTAYRLTLRCRGSNFHAWIDDHFLFSATDYGYAGEGYCGARATCVAFVTDFTARMLSDTPLPGRPRAAEEPPSLPRPKVAADLDLSALGPLSKSPRHNASIKAGRFLPGIERPQLIVKCFDHPEGATHALVDLDGDVHWTANWPGGDRIHALPAGDRSSSELVVVGKELMRVDATTGRITKRAPLPEVPGRGRIAPGNGPLTQADLDGDGVVDTFFLTCGADSPHLFAVGHDLALRWYLQTPSGQGHGRHLSVCDVDGDGREEVLAGCAMIGPDGAIRWAQQEAIRRLGCPNGGHIDSSQAGWFDGPDATPTVHYQGSSSGHLVIDARDGTLLAVHPQGHAQGGEAGRVVPGTEGVQVVSSNRWGSYGVTAIYDGQGRRLSRLQPGFTCQHATPLNWTGDGIEHLLVCDGQGYRGIYDHRGRRLVDLDALIPFERDPFEQRYDRVNTQRGPLISDACDDILIRLNSRLRILSADRQFPPNTRIYTPNRRGNVSWPAWSDGD